MICKKQSFFNKMLAIVLSVLMLVTQLPMGAFAVEASATAATSVDFALFLDTTSNNQKTTVTLAEGETLYYKNLTKAGSGSTELKCLTAADEADWNLKLDYTDAVPVMTLKGLDINSGFVGIAFGNYAAPITSDLVIVVEGDSTIVNLETSGSNYYATPALMLGTTGTVTIRSTGAAKLTLKSNNQYESNGKGTLYAAGNLVLDGAYVALDGDSAWGTSKFGIFAEGDVTVKDGELTSHQTNHLSQSIKCANFEAKDGAKVKIWALASDAVGADKPGIEADTIKIDAANIDIGAFDIAFSVDPEVTNVSFYKGSTQIPKWDGTPGEMTFKEDPGNAGDYTTWKTVKIVVAEEETETTVPQGTTPQGTTPQGTTPQASTPSPETDPEATEPSTPPVTGESVDFALFLDTTSNNSKTTVTLTSGETLYYKNLTKTGSGSTELKCLTTGDASDWNLKLDYTGEVPVMTMKGLDINSGFVGIAFGNYAAPITSDLVIVVEGDSTIAVSETTGNNYYNAPALMLGTTGTVTIRSTGAAKLTLKSNNQYESNGKGTLYAGGDLVLDGANVVLEGLSTWGESNYGIFAAGNVTVNGGELIARQNRYMLQAVKCAAFEAKNLAKVKIWTAGSDSIIGNKTCIEANSIKFDKANVAIGAFAKAFSVDPVVTNYSFYKGSTQSPKWSDAPGELTFVEDMGNPGDYTTWKLVKIVAAEEEPGVTEPSATTPTPTEPSATTPAPTEPSETTPEPTEPSVTTPVATEPGATEPEATEPAPTGPVVSVDNLTFTLNSDGESYSVTDCDSSATGSLIIPATYNNKPVTSIGEDAFSDCTCLTGITIPDGVTTIDYNAFYNCARLTSITLPDSITTIGERAFSDCTCLTGITIPDGVTTIGGAAFSHCTSLTGITIPDGITSIGYSTFFDCTSLTSVTIPNSVTSVGSQAFYNCARLTSITLPNSVTTISSSAFRICDSLTSITIPDSVTTIDEDAFFSCRNLAYVVLPKGMDIIGENAFLATGVEKVFHRGDQADWDWIVIKSGNDALTNATIIHNFTGTLEDVLGDGSNDATEPSATAPVATEPSATTPAPTVPSETTPEPTEPSVTTPVATEPEATEPEATEPEATEPSTPPVTGESVDFALFLDTTANNTKTTVTLYKGETLYYKNLTKAAHYNNKDLKCLTVAGETDWNLKLDYTGDVPVMTMKGLDINSGIVGIEFGSFAAPITSDLTIVVEGDSLITSAETTGNNYYSNPALMLGTTGTVTIRSSGAAKLSLQADNQNANNGNKATVYAAGNLVLEGANVAVEGCNAWGDCDYGIYAVGNVAVTGGELTVRQNRKQVQAIKCAAFEAKNLANVKIWAANFDSVSGNKTCIEADSIKINAANVSIGAFTKAFSVEPVITNCSFAKGSSQMPKWSGTPGDLTFTEDSGGNVDYSTWTQFKSVHVCSFGGDDGDCTTADVCVCGMVVEAQAAHVAEADDGDCTTAVKCANAGCQQILVAAKDAHIACEDDGDCTTAVKCANCEHILLAAKDAHVAGEDDGDCTTAVKCINCDKIVVAAKDDHIAEADDGDCTTAVKCANCEHIMVEGKDAHIAGEDDGDCTTAVKCIYCNKVALNARYDHTAEADDGDCTTAVACRHCEQIVVKAADAHIADEDDGDCTTAVKCINCDKIAIEANSSHIAEADDGDCTTAVKCANCDRIAIEANEHTFTDDRDETCDNPGCTHTRVVEPIYSAQLSMDSITAYQGETVRVDISITGNTGFAGLQFGLLFDNTYLTLKRVETQMDGFHVTVDNSVVLDALDNYTADGVIATLIFEVAEEAPVGAYNVQLRFMSGSNDTFQKVVMTDCETTITVKNAVAGDANGDDVVDMVDLVMLRKYLASMDPVTNVSEVTVQKGADYNEDGVIDAIDLVCVRTYLASMPVQ